MAGRVVINDQALRSLLTGQNGPVVSYMYDLGRQIQNEAKRRCPVDEGRLRASIENTVTVSGTQVIVRVGTVVEYALAVHNGTGIYGPSGQLIRPTNAKALSWKPRAGPRVFVKWVRGQRGNPFLTDAMSYVLTPLGWPITYRYPTGGPGRGAG
jgi:hypothetical protein